MSPRQRPGAPPGPDRGGSDQLTLKLWRERTASFSAYEPGPNAQALRCLAQPLSEYSPAHVYLWGARGVGKTHLLLGACEAHTAAGAQAVYLDLAACAASPGPGVLTGLERADLVCLDNLEAVATSGPWAHALFSLYERIGGQRTRLVFAADSAPAQVRSALPDLASRLARAVVFRLLPLPDEALPAALMRRAASRGFDLPEAGARFLVSRLPRRMDALCAAVDALDVHTLATHKKASIPAIKEILDL